MTTKYGNGDDNFIVGTSTDDELYGLGGNDILIGGGGNDYLNGGTGEDTMDGGKGDDTYVVDDAQDEIVEYRGNGNDTIRTSVTYDLDWAPHVENMVLTGSGDIDAYGSNVDNQLIGNSGDNHLDGYAGNDILKGGGGDDHLTGGAGDDMMVGGSGNDMYSVDSNQDVVTEYANQGTDAVGSSISYSLGANLENLFLTGVSQINGTGNELDNEIMGNTADNIIDGGTGADTMKGREGNDTYYVDQQGDKVIELVSQGVDTVESSVTFTLDMYVEQLHLTGAGNINGYGNGDHNTIIGNSGVNSLYGYGGDDTLSGYWGAATMYGGDGQDLYIVAGGDDMVIETVEKPFDGADTVRTTGDMSYILPDKIEILELDINGVGNNGTGNAMDNIIYGSINDNVIDGGLGADAMQGYAGDDTYYVDNSSDYIFEGANEGDDLVFSTVNYELTGYTETLSLAAGNAHSGTGNLLSNTIFGNSADNLLDGRGGADQLNGLGGNDTFVFQAGQANGDVVFEFEGNGAAAGDVLHFHGYGTPQQGATLVQLTDTEWQITSANGLIQDTITLAGAPTLDASDFVFFF